MGPTRRGKTRIKRIEGVGVEEFTYTLQEIEELHQCLNFNNNSIYGALTAFTYNQDISDYDVVHKWLPMAERLIKNPNFIVEHFPPAD